MKPSQTQLKNLIRDSVRSTIHSTLASVIQEATEEELRATLHDPAFKVPLIEIIKVELEQAIRELRSNGSRKSSKR